MSQSDIPDREPLAAALRAEDVFWAELQRLAAQPASPIPALTMPVLGGLATVVTAFGRVPPNCRHTQQTAGPPGPVNWIRRVESLDMEADGMGKFVGGYLGRPVDEALYWVQPGSLFIAATHRIRDADAVRSRYPEHDLQLYIYLPDDLWYALPDGALPQQTGWHVRAAELLRPWVVLSRGERVQVACDRAMSELEQAIAPLTSGDPAVAELLAAHEHLNQIRLATREHAPFAPPLCERYRMNIRDDFRTWSANKAAIFETTQDTVRDIILAELGVQPDTDSRDRPVSSSPRRRQIENRQRRNIRISRRDE